MKLPETAQAALLEKDNWENIIHSPEWVVYRKFLVEHLNYLQNEVNDHLRKHEDRKAGEALRAYDDAKKMLDLVTMRISMLSKTIEKGGK